MVKTKANYYAVAKGRRPGIYTDWPTCSAQVNGFSGSRFKAHGTLDEAKAWMRDYNAEKFAAVIEQSRALSGIPPVRSESTSSTPTALRADAPPCTSLPSLPFSSTWKPYGDLSQEVKFQLTQEICASQGRAVKPHDVKQLYERRRTRAMHDELETRFFVGTTSRLKGYQALC